MKIALLCGGPSLERGISLNSARTVLNHLEEKNIEILPIYFDYLRQPYRISPAQLYSNNPSDFDFKLRRAARPLSQAALLKILKSVDIAFPVMHGPFGEDGRIQAFLEKNGIPFVGTGAAACKRAFDKFVSNEYIRSHGFFAPPSIVLKIYSKNHKALIQKFFHEHSIKRAIVKPAGGGSSIGVFSVSTPKEALEKAALLFSKRMDTRVVVEPFAEGREFTTIILNNRFGQPVAILPTEIETDYAEHQIFDYRKKYLPTRQVTYHCPPRFSNEVIERIQVQAEQLFSLLEMRDFARFDGWILEDGNIWFSDFNPISGMEQNSFLFLQSSRVGLTHRDTLRFILKRACERYQRELPPREKIPSGNRKSVHVLFGGKTSERQVSVMSGTNVWLKLRQSAKYDPQPFLLDEDNAVWQLPYAYTLNHTVEEIVESCRKAKEGQARLTYLEQKVRLKLSLRNDDGREILALPKKMSLETFFRKSPFVFLALHGGDGENGIFQKKLSALGVKYNGSGEKVSRLCMDKRSTNIFIDSLGLPEVGSTKGTVREMKKISLENPKKLWQSMRKELGAETLIAKPRADGCSSGVAHLQSARDLEQYLKLAIRGAKCILPGTLKGQSELIEMPLAPLREILFEKFIATDIVRVKDTMLKYIAQTGWIEVTVGLVEEKGALRALNPSLTVSEGEVLSLEEKFQGGTGINITPPPPEIVRKKILQKTRGSLKKVAEAVGIRGYARIDAFLNVRTGKLRIIEINTLPGLTPSTVFFHQGLAENPSIYPQELLEKIIESAGY